VSGLNSSYINAGGATIDSNGFAVTLPQALLAPTGNGVSASGLTVSGGGYIATPQVVVTGGGGTGATAVATIDGSGNLTGITITNPGVNYTSAPTFSLFGGGAGNTGAVGGAATLAANTSGGLTKIGAGTLTLSGSNTFTGGVSIAAGTLQLGNTGALNSNAGSENAVTFGASSTGTLALAGNSVVVANLSTNAIPGTTFVQNANGSSVSNAILTVGNSTNQSGNYAGTIQNGTGGGTLGLTKAGTGTLTLSGTSSYSGATTVSAGTLFVTGALSNSATTVETTGTIGSNGANGSLGNGLTINTGGNLDLTGGTIALNSSNILSLTGGSLTLGNLTFQDLIGWDWLNAAEGTYELIDGSFSIDWGSTAYLSEATAYDFGNGKKGYFTSGSLKAVIVPEPGISLLGGLGLLTLLRRRRN